MLISAQIHEALLDAGVQVVDRGDGTVDLHPPGPSPADAVTFHVTTWNRSLGPARLAQLALTHPHARLLLIAPSFSSRARVVVEDRGWSWISAPTDGPTRGRLQLPGRPPAELGATRDPGVPDHPAPARGRTPWQRFAIIRHLLLGASWTQAGLVDICQVTQPRVSQVLTELHSDGLVARTGTSSRGVTGWVVSDYSRLFDQWVSTYPGPGGAAPTYWFGLDPLVDQVRPVISHLRRARPDQGNGPAPMASGDAAADLLAPYRRSQIAVVYSPWGADLTAAGLTPAPEETATLKLVVPTDTSIWPLPVDGRSTELAPHAPFPLADPLQVAWDLIDTGRPDADQAADAVKRALGDLRTRDQWT